MAPAWPGIWGMCVFVCVCVRGSAWLHVENCVYNACVGIFVNRKTICMCKYLYEVHFYYPLSRLLYCINISYASAVFIALGNCFSVIFTIPNKVSPLKRKKQNKCTALNSVEYWWAEKYWNQTSPDCLWADCLPKKEDESLAQLHTTGVVWPVGNMKTLGQGGALQEMD